MSKFTDHLWRDLVREHGPTLAHADRPEPGRVGGTGVLWRPRVLAGSTLGLAGVGAALVLALSAGGAEAPPAFAITNNSNGSVTVQINRTSGLVGANHKLTAMGIHEQIGIAMAQGTATVTGAVTCTPAPGVTNLPGPAVKVLVGTDGTQVFGSGNTGAGTYHLASCGVYPGNTSLATLRGY